MKPTSIIIAAVALIGCNSPPQHYSLGINDFSPEETELIVQAADRWVKMVNDKDELTINVFVGSCDPSNAGDTCILPSKDAIPYMAGIVNEGKVDYWGVTIGSTGSWLSGPNTFPMIYIHDERMKGDMGLFEHVAMHEIGHMLDLIHTNPGTVMYGGSKLEEVQDVAAQNITCQDVAQYVDLRGLPNKCQQ